MQAESSFPSPSILWSRVDQDGEVTNLEQQEIEDENFGTYTIPSAERSDAATYRCLGRYYFGSESVDINFIVISEYCLYTYHCLYSQLFAIAVSKF